MSKNYLFVTVAFITLALLVNEIMLTAIFHVLIGSFNTVLAISVALIGFSVSGIVAFIIPAARIKKGWLAIRGQMCFA